eukprot:4255996-Pleurochrysis_carterae.AAC.1
MHLKLRSPDQRRQPSDLSPVHPLSPFGLLSLKHFHPSPPAPMGSSRFKCAVGSSRFKCAVGASRFKCAVGASRFKCA